MLLVSRLSLHNSKENSKYHPFPPQRGCNFTPYGIIQKKIASRRVNGDFRGARYWARHNSKENSKEVSTIGRGMVYEMLAGHNSKENSKFMVKQRTITRVKVG